MCPYYLDGDLNSKEFGDYPLPACLSLRRAVATVQFSRVVREGRGRQVVTVDDVRAHGLSKLNSMLVQVDAVCATDKVRSGRHARPLGRSRPVDIDVHELESSE